MIKVGIRKDGRRGTKIMSTDNSFEEFEAGGSKEMG